MTDDDPGTERAVHYYPNVFEVGDMEAAKAIILTDEGPGADTATRWALETPYLAGVIGEQLNPRPGSLILDYGCGIGRLARPLIEQFGCQVIGVDISASMRALASTYVADERFGAVSPAQFDLMVEKGLRVDAAISVWVLQHCFDPAADVARIRRGLAEGAPALVINMRQRAVPAVEQVEAGYQFQWASDEQDILTLLSSGFEVEAEGDMETDDAPNMADAGAFWARLRRKP